MPCFTVHHYYDNDGVWDHTDITLLSGNRPSLMKSFGRDDGTEENMKAAARDMAKKFAQLLECKAFEDVGGTSRLLT